MSIVNSFQNGDFKSFKTNTQSLLNARKTERLGEFRKEVAEKLIIELQKVNEETYYVYRTDSDGVVTVGDCFNMGKFKDSNSAEDALKQMKDAVRRNEKLYTAGNYFYHILPQKDADQLSKLPKEDEEEGTEIDISNKDEIDLNQDDEDSGDGGMSESVNVYEQLISISKGKGSNLTFSDGDKSVLTTESAKKILKSINAKKGVDKDKSINGLSKNYESFMQTLNNIVTESYIIDISKEK